MIDFYNTVRYQNIEAHVIANIHDEIIITCKESDSLLVSDILKQCMEKNRVTSRLDVEMKTDPIIGKNLAECK